MKTGKGSAAVAKIAQEAGWHEELHSLTAEPGATRTYEIDPFDDPRWAALVESHPRSSVFHGLKWLRALKNVYGYQPVVVTTCAAGRRLTNGIVFCLIDSWLTGRRFVSLPFSDHCDPLIDSQAELDALLVHMRQRVLEGKFKYVEIRPISNQPSAETGFGEGVRYFFHRLDLRPRAEELVRNFHKSCVQRKIRRAENEKLRYEEGASEGLLRRFYRLLVMTRRRQYLPPQPLDWFRGLVAAFGEDLKIRVASKDDIDVASILTLSHRKTVTYKYGCSNTSFNRLGGTALLFWKTIQEAKERGFEELEMGRSDIDNLGLTAFKEHWGAARTSIRYWSYPGGPTGVFNSWKDTSARRVISICPDVALETIGKLFYKHIG
jgi:CelD/BcsL family acetyltransferase involved in cellulose biosynthesis